MYIFDENDTFFRNPAGALELSESLTLRIKLKRGEALNPRVCLYPDDGEAFEVMMDYECAAGGYDVYKTVFEFENPWLYWYCFLVDSAYGTTFQVPEYAGGSFQITVFKPDTGQPDWIRGGLIYHIFVDRFRHGGGQLRLSPGAVRRSDWGGCPYFLPDEKEVVHNNDFFGGDLYGVIEKLPYLEELGVTCIYLSPVFEAASNHKYDTGDFMKIDVAFGGDEALEKLCGSAGELGIRVILDGVFNHVGSDSKYFNRYGRYDNPGAYSDQRSPYRDWFTFNDDGSYEAWWGIELLPAINKQNKQYEDFICGENGVIAFWTKKGISGWRLDVVDELPDILLDPLCSAIKRENSSAFITGEVWEDASNKISYDVRRRYFLGGQLDSVTNYPLRNAIIACVKDGDIIRLADTMADLCRNYPKHILDSLMNIIGTHDTVRILTVLSGADLPEGRIAMSHFKLSEEELALAKKRLRLASALQFTLPGVPCVYYGDEAGMEGGADPFNRICYPWGHEDTDIISWYKELSRIRKENSCFKDGGYTLIEARDGLFVFTRGSGAQRILVAVNVSDEEKNVTAPDFNFDILASKETGLLTVEAGKPGIFGII